MKINHCLYFVTLSLLGSVLVGPAFAQTPTLPEGVVSKVTNAGDVTGAPGNLAAGQDLIINGTINTNGSRGVNANAGGSTITINSTGLISTTGQDAVRVGAGSTINHHGSIILNGTAGGHHGIDFAGAGTANVTGSIVVNSGGGDGLNGSGASQTFILNGANIQVNGGGHAVNTGGGNDTITIQSSRITASGGGNAIRGGSGDDTVNLNGFSKITGLINGRGDTPGAGDVLNLNNWRGFSQAQLNGLLADNGPVNAVVPITLFGQTFSIRRWETVNIINPQPFSNLISVPGLGGFSSALDASVSGGVPTEGFMNLFLALNSVPESELNEFAKTASAQVFHHAYSNIAFNNATQFTSNLFGQIRNLGRNAQEGHDLTAFRWDTKNLSPLMASMDQRLVAMSGPGILAVDTASAQSATMAGATASGPVDPYYDWQTFIMGSGSIATQDATSALAESETITTSATIGFGKNLCESTSVGLYTGYHGVDAEVDRFNSEADGKGAQVGAYAKHRWGDWLASGILGYDYTAYDNNRNIVSPAFTGTANSDAVTHQLTSAVELAREIHLGEDRSWRVTPKAGLQYSLLHVESYTESGLGGANLSFDSQEAHSLRTHLGFDITKTFEGDWGWLAPYVSAAWHHEFLDNSRDITTSFTDPALASFTVSTEEADANFGTVGAGFNASLTEAENIHFTLGWQCQFGQEGYIANTAMGGFRVDL